MDVMLTVRKMKITGLFVFHADRNKHFIQRAYIIIKQNILIEPRNASYTHQSVSYINSTVF